MKWFVRKMELQLLMRKRQAIPVKLQLRRLTLSKSRGLVLSGGGARGAYQAGVVKAIGQIAKDRKVDSPFQIYSGISAGSINAAYLAGSADQFPYASEKLVKIWSELNTERIVSVSPFSLGRIGAGLIKQLSTGALTKKTPVKALLETDPLRELISSHIREGAIQSQIDCGVLKGLAITATSYNSSHARTFVQADQDFRGWVRVRRESEIATIGVEHIMASSAIPMLFPPVQVDGEYFGDGGVRNNVPLSPAIHLGAEKLMIVGVKMDNRSGELRDLAGKEPSLARVVSVLIHGLLMDSIDLDVARLKRINHIVSQMDEASREKSKVRHIDHIWIAPSKYLGEIALKWVDKLPKPLKYMIGGLGSDEEAADLISYLLFEKEYCDDLIDLGFHDAMSKESEISEFLTSN